MYDTPVEYKDVENKHCSNCGSHEAKIIKNKIGLISLSDDNSGFIDIRTEEVLKCKIIICKGCRKLEVFEDGVSMTSKSG